MLHRVPCYGCAFCAKLLLSFPFSRSNVFPSVLTLNAVDFGVYHSYEGQKFSQSHSRPGGISQISEHMNHVCTSYTVITGYNYTGSPYKNKMVIKSIRSWPCSSIAVFHRLLHKSLHHPVLV